MLGGVHAPNLSRTGVKDASMLGDVGNLDPSGTDAKI